VLVQRRLLLLLRRLPPNFFNASQIISIYVKICVIIWIISNPRSCICTGECNTDGNANTTSHHVATTKFAVFASESLHRSCGSKRGSSSSSVSRRGFVYCRSHRHRRNLDSNRHGIMG